jgi:hypothetical protein
MNEEAAMRDDDAPDIRALLRAEAEHAPRPSGMGQESFRKASAHRTAFLSASILSIVLVIAAIGFGATWIAYDGPDDQRPVNPASIATPPEPVTPDCGQISLSREEYGTDLDQRRGEPGETVKLSGTTQRGEDGRWAASDRLEAWWNTDVPNGAPLIEGPVIRLLTVTNMETCRFEATFEVPDVEPGRYKISVFAWSANPDNGYGFALPHYFNVTTDPSTGTDLTLWLIVSLVALAIGGLIISHTKHTSPDS